MDFFNRINKKLDWAYTLVIPAGCKIGDRRYRELASGEQACLLQRVMKAMDHEKISIFHEEHKDGRIHVHGTVYDMYEKDMHVHQVNVNLQFGYKLDSNKLFHYKKKQTDGWESYCRKQQDAEEVFYQLGDPRIDFQLPLTASHPKPVCPDLRTDYQDLPTVSPESDDYIDQITVNLFKP